jgi:hypothetical protein
MAVNGHANGTQDGYTNYVAYSDPKAQGQSRIGHLDLEKSLIQPLSFESGAPLSNLYEVIEIGESHIKPSGEPFALSSVQLLAPISGRDILAVGKNYFEHAIEFNSSGYDSSDVCTVPRQSSSYPSDSSQLLAPPPNFCHQMFYRISLRQVLTWKTENRPAYSPCDFHKASYKYYCSRRANIPASWVHRYCRL